MSKVDWPDRDYVLGSFLCMISCAMMVFACIVSECRPMEMAIWFMAWAAVKRQGKAMSPT